MRHHFGPRPCTLCRRPLPQSAPEDQLYCDAPACQTRARMAQASSIGKTHQIRRTRMLKTARSRAADATEIARDRMIAQDPEAATAPIVTALAPLTRRALVPLPPDRVQDFQTHLSELLDQAFVYGPPAPHPRQSWEMEEDDAPENRQAAIDDEPMTMTAACIACQGLCCLLGGTTNAFLTQRTLRAVRQNNPDLTRDEVASLYLDRIPATSTYLSCVFHGEQGCTLPREIRAGVCNRWQCSYRETLRTELQDSGADRVIITGFDPDHTDHPEANTDTVRMVAFGPGGLQIHEDLGMTPLTE